MDNRTERKIERYIDRLEQDRNREGLERMSQQIGEACERLNQINLVPGATYTPGKK